MGGEGKGDGGHGDDSEVMDLDLGDPETTVTRVDLTYRDRW